MVDTCLMVPCLSTLVIGAGLKVELLVKILSSSPAGVGRVAVGLIRALLTYLVLGRGFFIVWPGLMFSYLTVFLVVVGQFASV